MKNKWKKAVSGIMAAVLLLTGCQGTTPSELEEVGTEYENDYILQHVNYARGTEFSYITSTNGNLAGSMARVYEDAKLNAVHKTWKMLSTVFLALGEGKLELTNEYEVMLSQIMQSSMSVENLEDSYEFAVYAAYRELFEEIRDQLKQTTKNVSNVSDGAYKNAEKLLNQVDDILVFLQEMKGAKKGTTEKLFTEELEKCKKKLDEVFLGEENSKFLMDLKIGLGIGADVFSLTSDSLSDFVDEYVLIRASFTATDEWCRSWEAIADYLRDSKDSETQKISKALDYLIGQIKAGKEDSAKAMIEGAKKSTYRNLAEYTLKQGSNLFDEATKDCPVIQGIRKGLTAGVTTANSIVNMDDIAYYGQMLMGSGLMAIYAEKALDDAAEKLLKNQTYKNALYFDSLFHIYQQIQLNACDYTIQYNRAIIDNPAGYIFRNSTYDEAADIWMLQADKLIWEQYSCHSSIYYNYILDEYMDDPGLIETGKKAVLLETQELNWDERSGILSAWIGDLDGDGWEELALLTVENREPDEVLRAGHMLQLSLYTIENGAVSWKDTVDVLGMNNLQRLHANILAFSIEDEEQEKTGFLLQAYWKSLPADYSTPIYAGYQYDADEGKLRESFRLQQTEGGTSGVGYGMRCWNEESGNYEEFLALTGEDGYLREIGRTGKYDQEPEPWARALQDLGFPEPQEKLGNISGLPSWIGIEGFERICTIENGGTSGSLFDKDARYHYWMSFQDGTELEDKLNDMEKYR